MSEKGFTHRHIRKTEYWPKLQEIIVSGLYKHNAPQKPPMGHIQKRFPKNFLLLKLYNGKEATINRVLDGSMCLS